MYNNCKPCLTIREFFKIVYRNAVKAYRNIRDELAAYKRINQTACVISEQAESMRKVGGSILKVPYAIYPPSVEYNPEKAKSVQEEIEKTLEELNIKYDHQIRTDK